MPGDLNLHKTFIVIAYMMFCLNLSFTLHFLLISDHSELV